MKIFVQELQNSFKVKFSYSDQAVEAMRAIPGRQFRRDLGNAWLVPKTSQKALRRFIDTFEGTAAVQEVQRPYDDPETVSISCTKGPPQWPHQVQALKYIWNAEAALIDLNMGTGGKSRIIVDFVCNKRGIKRVLILCPHSVIRAWELQFAKYAGRPVGAVCLDKKSVKDKMMVADTVLRSHVDNRRDEPVAIVINYESVWRDPFGEWAIDANFDLLVLDEIQRVRGAGSQIGKYAYRLGSAISTRIGLSGTPFPHEPIDDCYGVYRTLSPTIFGTSLARHRSKYAIMGGWENRQIIGRINQTEMQTKINSIRFHVIPDESTLPGEVHTDIPVELPNNTKKLYRRLEDDFYAKVESGEIVAANAGVAAIRLSQLTSGYARVEGTDGTFSLKQMHTAKLDVLVDLLTDLPDTEPVVVFCRFRYDLDQIHAAAAKLGRSSSELSGRKHQLQEWQAGKTVILAAQLRASAEGVDMTRTHIAVYFGYSYSNGDYRQSLKRLLRPGQLHTCLYYHLCVPHSVDTRIRRALDRGQEVIDALLET